MPLTKKETDSLATAVAGFVCKLVKEDRARITALEQVIVTRQKRLVRDAQGRVERIVDELDVSALPPADRLDGLEQRLAAIEAKPHVKFCGVYQSGKTYAPGDAVTHQGGLWVCKAETCGAPSQDFVGWQLAVKRGRDGKDARHG